MQLVDYFNVLPAPKVGKGFVETEVAPGPGLEPLTVESSDKAIEDRLHIIENPHCHMAGTCATEKVVDTNIRVKGVQKSKSRECKYVSGTTRRTSSSFSIRNHGSGSRDHRRGQAA